MQYIAFLRGINLGKRRVKMNVLVEQFELLGFANVSTFIASGNVVFDTDGRDVVAMEDRVQRQLHDSLGYEVDTFIRTSAELGRVLRAKPIVAAANGTDVHVSFMKKALPARLRKVLHGYRTDADRLHVHGRQIYWSCDVTVWESSVWNEPEIRSCALPTMTMRKIDTLRRLAAKHQIA